MDVLLVDDEPKNLLALSALLEDLGARIHCVNSGEDALRQVLKRQFAAVLLDVRMPGIDGFETAAAIRDAFCELILKPVDPDVIRPRVQVHLEKFRKTPISS